MKKLSLLALILSTFLILCHPTLAETEQTTEFDDTLTQISIINALMKGVYDGETTYGQLKQFGDFGIGTFNALNGEMIAFDGVFYQVLGNGQVRVAQDDMKTPFASVTFFNPDEVIELPRNLTFDELEAYIDDNIPTENTFYAIRVDGTFSYMKTRSVQAQTKPYPPLLEVAKDQAEFEFENVEGTVVGFRCPTFVKGINVVGYHLHFLEANQEGGGHILDFVLISGVCKIDRTPRFYMVLPARGSAFYSLNLSADLERELQTVEG